jgi:ABC-2 type transport system ATP-binding protein
MIVTENLSKYFKDFLAVNKVTLQVNPGEVLALLGPNGAGKTTTVRMLSSILSPSTGRAEVAGYDVVSQAEKVRASVGLLTEMHGLYGRMPADEYLDFFGQLYKMNLPARQKRTYQLLEQFGLTSNRSQRISEYSKGMRQKLALARALLHDPPVLLLDEPTSAMDPESARLVRDTLQALRSAERTIVVCTHNLVEAEELADKIAIIRRGKIIAIGSPSELKQTMLGPAEYEVRFGTRLDSQTLILASNGIQITQRGPDWLRFLTAKPQQVNPQVLRYLLGQNLPVVSLQEVPRSLEDVYIRAVNAPN